MALRWKRDGRPQGLAGIVCGPLGSTLRDGDTQFATVSALRDWSTARGYKGWYWVAGRQSGIPYKNTCDEPAPDEITAKAQAMAYVKEHRVAAPKLGEQEGGK